MCHSGTPPPIQPKIAVKLFMSSYSTNKTGVCKSLRYKEHSDGSFLALLQYLTCLVVVRGLGKVNHEPVG